MICFAFVVLHMCQVKGCIAFTLALSQHCEERKIISPLEMAMDHAIFFVKMPWSVFFFAICTNFFASPGEFENDFAIILQQKSNFVRALIEMIQSHSNTQV